MPTSIDHRPSFSVQDANPYRSPSAEGQPVRRRGGKHGVRRDLLFSVLDAAFFSVMVGLAETYLPAFILELRGGQIASGLITALPLLCGATLQLASPFIVRRVGSHKRFVVATAALQALSMLCLPLAASFDEFSVMFVFTAAMFYYASGLAAGPAWNTWIEGLVPRKVRTRFFARRVRISQACILIGFVAGGWSLQYGRQHAVTLTVFGALFLIGACCRFASALFLTAQSVPRHPLRERHVGFASMFRGRRGNQSSKLLAYLFSMQAAAFIAGPYFVPFMLKHLEMSYAQYSSLLGISFFAKVATLPLWGRLAHRAGPHRLLWIGGLSIIPMSALWLVSRNYYYLLGLQFAAGLTWAAYELAFFLLFFEAIPREERTSVLTIHNFGNAAAQVTGAFLGALYLWHFGPTYESYLWLFGLSTVARALTVVLLLRVPKSKPREREGMPGMAPVTVTTGD